MRPPLIPNPMPINKHDNEPTKIMKSLYNTLVDHREPKTNRILIQLFMCLPSRKDFPEYFDIIEKPISMYKIRERIEQNIYKNEEACVADFKMMFNNCRIFNDDESQIYLDAVNLETLLLEKYHLLTKNNNKQNHNHNNNHHPHQQNQQQLQQQPQLDPPHQLHHNHNEDSIDSSSNLSLSASNSAPSEKKKRAKANPDTPKRRLLTGYIIYASEVRKEYVEKHPNQDFGFISRLIGNDWKALPRDLRSKYDQRALAHNKKIRERAIRESILTPDGRPTNGGLHTPKMSKRKLAKLAKEQMRQHHLSSTSIHDNSSMQTPMMNQDRSQPASQSASSSYKLPDHQYSQPMPPVASYSVESATQTTHVRFVEPPTRKRFAYSETFRRYIDSLEVPNKDLLAEETGPERRREPVTSWFGAGIGRHESPEAALWALRDFMLQDDATMRWSIQPYLCY